MIVPKPLPPDLFPRPPMRTLPLSRGGDLHAVFVHFPQVVDGAGDPVLDGEGQATFAEADFPAGCTVTVVLDVPDPGDPIVVACTVSGSEALVLADHIPVDQLVKPVLWRLVLTGADGVDDVLMNGVTDRSDGKS